MTQKSKTSTRKFSKKATAWALTGIFALAFYGMHIGVPDLAGILTVIGSVSIAHLVLYMGVGHLDLRTLVAQGLLDLRRKRGPDA